MALQEIQRPNATATPLTTLSGLDRLLGMMARWWDGGSLAHIARECGVSRQRAAALLATVGCTRAARHRADHDRPDSGRRALAAQVARARADLLDPQAGRLTVRQRAALAWQASGLASVDIARRMGTTPQNVRNLQVAACWRLERLSRPKRRRAGRRTVPCEEPAPMQCADEASAALDWNDLMPSLDQFGTNESGAAEEAR
ncbi:MAG: hypothetical protein L6Q92_16820 [Phycisphaerae bacterium]|nr:hypothetical protein [Phycisphaerae bacterium]